MISKNISKNNINSKPQCRQHATVVSYLYPRKLSTGTSTEQEKVGTKALNNFKTNGGKMIYLNSRVLAMKASSSSVASAAGRLDRSSEKYIKFWVEKDHNSIGKLNSQHLAELYKLRDSVSADHAMLLLVMDNLWNLEEVNFLKDNFPKL